ncbi:MAG TPA: polysaccharide biosynthesis protein [Pseudoalteromonas sp.]|nr:polysaccharide biosynthesis protein [Pseudoalteromonas sp.]
MSLKKNIIANYASQLYVTGVGILILPLYIKYMGAEAYGLVGFFTMLQAFFAMLDLGLTPTIGRETARYHGGSMCALKYRQLLRALTVIFIFIAVVGGVGLWLFAGTIATSWLTVETLSLNVVTFAIQVMAISVALRWLCGLYRGVVTGSEKLVWLSIFNVFIASLRFVAVFISMWLYGYTPTVFFIHQLVVAVIELLGLWIMAQFLIPNKALIAKPIGWSFKPIKPILSFALTIAFTSSVWVLVTQTDKLILSGILPLEEYGYFTLAVLVAGGIMVISGPVSSAIMPRMARLHAENRHAELISVYRNCTQLVSVIAGSASITLVVTAKPLLIAWTGDLHLAEQAAPVLRLYAAGNLFLCIAAFSYYLQYAKGNLRYHLLGNLGLVIILIPSVIFAATHFGALGAGYVWLTMNALFLFGWVAYVHHKLEPGLHFKWLVKDCLLVYCPVIAALSFISMFPFQGINRWENLIYLMGISLVALIIAAISSSFFRNKLVIRIKGI